MKNIIDTGTGINADLSSSLILTIFGHDGPLHDGAAVVQGGKLVARAVSCPYQISRISDGASEPGIAPPWDWRRKPMRWFWPYPKRPEPSPWLMTATFSTIWMRKRYDGAFTSSWD
jgi:hypothetical protein